MRTFLLGTLLISAAAPAVAQTPARFHISFGYRYLQAHSISSSSNLSPGVKRLGVGGEVGVAVRVAPAVSLVGAFGRSNSGAITVPAGGVSSISHPGETGTVSYSIVDVMAGVKLSRIGPGPFVALLAGISTPGEHFNGVSSSGQTLDSLDQGKSRSFALRPMVGVEFGGGPRRVGARIEAGWDIIRGVDNGTFTSAQSDTVTHFRVAASLTIAIGR